MGVALRAGCRWCRGCRWCFSRAAVDSGCTILLLSYRTICNVQEGRAKWTLLAQMVRAPTICTSSATICIFELRRTAVEFINSGVDFINNGGGNAPLE